VVTPLVEITRGNLVESSHFGMIAVADPEGRLIAAAGDPETRTFFRSSAKPFQAVPLVESGAADRYGFTPAELALCCSSHDAAPWQQQAVAAMLERIGLGPDALQCGIAPPYDEQEAARVTLKEVPPTPLQCDCSGKHTGMLATCLQLGYSIESYLEPEHPLQQEIRRIMASVLRMEEGAIEIAPDGCSVPTFGAPIRSFATAYAALAAPERVAPEFGGRHAEALDRLRSAMAGHPRHIAGPGELDTDIIEVTSGRLIAKLGAEGLLCIAAPDDALGIAISILDGSERPRTAAALATLEQLDLLRDSEREELRDRQSTAVTNFNGWTVGEMRAAFQLR
jgi:L-asparaginase II